MKVNKSSRALMGWLPACIGLIAALSLVGCAPLAETPGDAPAPAAPTADLPESSGLSEEEAAALSSLEKVDDYPLYSMHFTGDYELRAAVNPVLGHFVDDLPASRLASWGCSLFASLAVPDNLLYGRNFDWEYSPALLLFTDPPQGYASVSMVDIAYLGYAGEEAKTLTALPLAGRKGLLDAPFLPFDGMNEHGLVVGMAAVPSGNMSSDPKKETVGSLGVIRKIWVKRRTWMRR